MFLRNVWYAAGHSETVEFTPTSRRICDEPIMFYRTGNSSISALHDRCPHRFVPLSAGKVEGDVVQCGYHGLRFDQSGQCVLNPHGPIFPQLRVRSYPVVERYGLMWIWMGDADKADAALIPDFSPVCDEASLRIIRGYTHVNANYELISDNLLDLSHVEYLHPDFARREGFGNFKSEMARDGNTITAYLWKPNSPITAFQRMLWDTTAERADSHVHMRWDPPSLLYLDTGVTECGAPVNAGASFPSAHFLTPETATTSHYFWVLGRNVKRDDAKLHARLVEVGNRIFSTEDKPMIERQQSALGCATDLLAQEPAILPVDKAGLRARRLLKLLIKNEQGALTERSPEPTTCQSDRT